MNPAPKIVLAMSAVALFSLACVSLRRSSPDERNVESTDAVSTNDRGPAERELLTSWLELSERIDVSLEGATEPLRGRVDGLHGARVLSLDDVELARLADDGVPCPAELSLDEVVIATFEGAEALALVAGEPPVLVGLEERSRQLRCWGSGDYPMVSRTQDSSLPRLAGERRDDERLVEAAEVELAPGSDGAEQVTLQADAEGVRVTVTNAAGSELLAWSEQTGCEESRSELIVERRADGVALQLEHDCSSCVDCEHGHEREVTNWALWWPDEGRVIEVEVEVWMRSGEDAGDRSVEVEERGYSRRWPLASAVVHYENLDSQELDSVEICDDDVSDECCSESVTTVREYESWTLILGDETFVHEISDGSPNLEHEQDCY